MATAKLGNKLIHLFVNCYAINTNAIQIKRIAIKSSKIYIISARDIPRAILE